MDAGPPFDVIAYALLSGLGVLSLGFLGLQAYEAIARRRTRSEAETPARGSAGEPADEDGAADRTEPDGEAPSRSGALAPPRRKASPARRRLQELLNEGVSLQQNVPDIHPLTLAPSTREPDVKAWEAAVEAELIDQGREREIGLFYYEPPRSPLASLSIGMQNPLRRRLHLRLQQLEVIVKRTR